MIVSPAISRIAIVGDELQAWTAAAILAQQLPDSIRLTLVETGDKPVGTIGLDHEDVLLPLAGITEIDLLMAADASLSLGEQFVGWRGDRSLFFSAPSGKLPALEGAAFHHVVLRAAMARNEPSKLPEIYGAFRFAARAAAAGKLSHPSPNPQSPLTMLRPAIHVDAARYADLLQSKAAENHAIRRAPGPVSAIETDDSGTMVTTLITEQGERIESDLVIDLDEALHPLAKASLACHHDHIFPAMPFDRALTVERGKAAIAFGAVAAGNDGIIRQTPLRSESVRQQYVCSTDTSDGEVLEASRADLPWTGNLVRAGRAAASFGPCLAADTRFLHEQLARLCTLIPTGTDMSIEASEYNRLSAILSSQLRDYHWLPFALNRRPEEPWRQMREADLPDSLAIRLEQFRSRGRFVTFDGELFEEQDWIDRLIGFGIVPERFDPMAAGLNMNQVGQSLGQMVDVFNKTIEAMAPHADYMARFVNAAQSENSLEFPQT